MKVRADGFEFEFPGAVAAFVFDEQQAASPRFHGISHAMKAVDLVVEFPDQTLFIEVKDFHQPDDYNFQTAQNNEEAAERMARLHHLREVLVKKFRDTWLYRWSERAAGEPDKPIHYLCVLSLGNGMLGRVKKELGKGLPAGVAGPRWQRELVRGFAVLNTERWNSVFPGWPLSRY